MRYTSEKMNRKTFRQIYLIAVGIIRAWKTQKPNQRLNVANLPKCFGYLPKIECWLVNYCTQILLLYARKHTLPHSLTTKPYTLLNAMRSESIDSLLIAARQRQQHKFNRQAPPRQWDSEKMRIRAINLGIDRFEINCAWFFPPHQISLAFIECHTLQHTNTQSHTPWIHSW